MSLLNFETNDRPSGGQGFKKLLRLTLGIGVLVSAISLGSTFASKINLNSGTPVEFGQGVAATTACDSNIVITPNSSFVNSDSGGSFKLTSINLSDVDLVACAGKDLVIKAFGNSSTLLNFIGSVSSITVADNGTSFVIPQYEDIVIDPIDSSSFNLVIDPANPTALSAGGVYRLTIESQSPIKYQLGQTGPAGGTVFYSTYENNALGFDCGLFNGSTGSPRGTLCHYLEAAPSDWNSGSDPALPWAVTDFQGSGVPGIPNNPSLTDIGGGYFNSAAIVNQGNRNSTAAGLARAYKGQSLIDWYLPNTAELNALCKYASSQSWTSDSTECTGTATPLLGLLSNDYNARYWSSSEFDSNRAWLQYFFSGALMYEGAWRTDYYNGQQYDLFYKSSNFLVRPIRAF